MAKPDSILGSVRGFARDFSLEEMPKGYVWDLQDYIPDKRGAKLESRGPWTYMTTASMAGTVWGGLDAVFEKGEKLLVAAGGNVYDHPRALPGAATVSPTSLGAMYGNIVHNGKILSDRVYFVDGAGLADMKYVVWTGASPTLATITSANTPNPKVSEIHKGRLIVGGGLGVGSAALASSILYFSPLEIDGGPIADWDAKSWITSSRPITALGVLGAQIFVFHDGQIERIRGSIPPTTSVDTDMEMDVFSAQHGCVDPASVCYWQENMIFANAHGVQLTDGSAIRSLTDQGGIGELWRYLYALKRSGTQVSCGVYLNYLCCSVLTTFTGATAMEDRSMMFVCDLDTRTWFHFSNVGATAMIPSTTGNEQVWWGVEGQNVSASFANRLAHLSPLFLGLSELDPDNPLTGSFPNAVDPNGSIPILPDITLPFVQLGKEGQKRIRTVYVSHATETQTPVEALQVSYRLTPLARGPWTSLGTIPSQARYDRKRLPLGRNAYGIQVNVRQVAPTRITRLYDISIDGWVQDKGKVA